MRRALLTTLVVATACGLRDVSGPPGREQVVVQGILNAQRAEQELWIERSTPAGEPIGGDPLPLQPPPSRVEVRDTAGNVFSFSADTANPRRFVATFTPVAGARYDLLIEVGSRVVQATAVVPRTIAIVDPALDSVIAAPNSLLSVAWTGPNRWVRVAAVVPDSQTFDVLPQWVMNDTTAQVMIYPSYPRVVVWVLAVDSVTARAADPAGFRGDFEPFGQFRGNITGGTGFFGAATSDHVIVRVQ
ncbi:MAG TPA: DUF4249 family protein [Gemmatimonadales bacterium]|jgi:hypothetical protein|nr:DUF4249 family protein [Gemmatimonadales bacterium]